MDIVGENLLDSLPATYAAYQRAYQESKAQLVTITQSKAIRVHLFFCETCLYVLQLRAQGFAAM